MIPNTIRAQRILEDLLRCQRTLRALDPEAQGENPAWDEIGRGLVELQRFTQTGEDRFLDYAQLHANGCGITLDCYPTEGGA